MRVGDSDGGDSALGGDGSSTRLQTNPD